MLRLISLFSFLIFTLPLLAQSEFAPTPIIKRISVENFNLNYEFPHGTGVFTKISARGRVSPLYTGSFPFELNLTEEPAFILSTEAFELVWENPPAVLSQVNKIVTENLNVSTQNNEHGLSVDKLIYGPDKKENYEFKQITFKCLGSSTVVELKPRVFEDCKERLDSVIVKMDDFFLRYILSILGKVPLPDGSTESMVNDLEISVTKGKLSIDYAVRYVISTALRIRGTLSYENDYNTIVVKVASMKYGIIPVTTLVMNQLKARIKNPRVKITPPWIRIQLN